MVRLPGSTSLVAAFACILVSACVPAHGAATPAQPVELRRDGPKQHSTPVRVGAGRQLTFPEFRRAVEHYEAGVVRGNTLALGAAADAYAAYLRAFHTQLHLEYVHHFLAGVRAGTFDDPELMTKVEIVIEPDGSLHRLGVVKSSGDVQFDFGAFNSVMRGAPYPPPPRSIQSPDGRTYLRWALHRDHSQCGTWNAEPFILRLVMLPEPPP